MLNGKDNENGKTERTKTNKRSDEQKRNIIASAAHVFVHFFCCFPRETPRDFLVTRSMRKRRMFFCLLIFFNCRSFLP